MIVASVLLIVLAPILAIAILAIVVDTPGSPFFSQVRMGRDRTLFKLLKLRTMTQAPRALAGEIRPGSEGVTRAGGILRRLRIDELPQLVNVIRGDMSLVGPRPMLPEQDGGLPRQVAARHDVRPGMTGLAQVCGNTYIPWEERWVLDAAYARSVSLHLDLRILVLTVGVLLFGESRFVGMHTRPYLKMLLEQ